MIERLPDWPARFYALLAELGAEPLAWGRHDCGQFAGRVLEALTGRDYLVNWRDRYASPREALRALRAAGGLESVVCAALGPPAPPLSARRGDLVAIEAPVFGLALGVADGAFGHFVGRTGLNPIPRWQFCRAWRV